MKRILCILFALILAFSSFSCGEPQANADETAAPDESVGPEEPMITPNPASSEIDGAATPEELYELIALFEEAGDDLSVYRAALKLAALAPGDTKAYALAADALMCMTKDCFTEINVLLEAGATSATDAEAIVAWAQSASPELAFELPFTPDYASSDQINVEGTTAGNLTSGALRINGEWRGGFLTSQAGWIYFARIDENFALYKMRTDGGALQRIGTARGFSLNVVGDWIYYADLDDGSRIYKIRTDGSMRTKLSEDACSFLSVSEGFLFYDSGFLYKQNIETGERVILWETMPILPCVSGNYVYSMEKSERGGLWRIPVEGGAPEKLSDGAVRAYCIHGGALYYILDADPYAVWSIPVEGGSREVYRGEEELSAINFVGDGLYVCAGRYLAEEGMIVGGVIFQIDIGTNEIQSAIDARTIPLCAVGDCLFYMEYTEGMAWHGLNPGSEKEINMTPAELEETAGTQEPGDAVPVPEPVALTAAADIPASLAPGETSADAYIAAADALCSLAQSYYAEINRILAAGYANAEAGEIMLWAEKNRAAYRIDAPLLPGEINTVGITAGNMTNAAKLFGGWWYEGLLTWQGDWVYLTRPDENFAIYRMRADGSEYGRMGETHGHSLNALGSWVYFINLDDGEKPYRMRLDGGGLEKLTDDACAFLSVAGDSLYYHNANDGGCLYRVKIDGSGSLKLNDMTTMFACVYGDWVYFEEKSLEGGLFRVSIDGGEKQTVATGNIFTYCIEGDWVYYLDHNNVYCIWRVRLDGTETENFYPCPMTLNTLNISGGTLVLPYNVVYQEDCYNVTEKFALVDMDDLSAQPRDYFEDIPFVCTGPDGRIYYMRHSEGLAWYAMDESGNVTRVGG